LNFVPADKAVVVLDVAVKGNGFTLGEVGLEWCIQFNQVFAIKPLSKLLAFCGGDLDPLRKQVSTSFVASSPLVSLLLLLSYAPVPSMRTDISWPQQKYLLLSFRSSRNVSAVATEMSKQMWLLAALEATSQRS
jgi:hypothetical protein